MCGRFCCFQSSKLIWTSNLIFILMIVSFGQRLTSDYFFPCLLQCFAKCAVMRLCNNTRLLIIVYLSMQICFSPRLGVHIIVTSRGLRFIEAFTIISIRRRRIPSTPRSRSMPFWVLWFILYHQPKKSSSLSRSSSRSKCV